jgi:hypothetical protein
MFGQGLPSLVAPIGFNWQISITLVPGLAAREVAVATLGTVYTMSSADSTVAAQLTPVIAAGWPRATAFSLLAWYVFASQWASLSRHGLCPVKPPPAATVTESSASVSRRKNRVPASATLRQEDLGNAKRNSSPRQRDRRVFVPRQAMDHGIRVG